MAIKTDKIRQFAGEEGAFGQSIFIKEVYEGYHEGWVGPEGGKQKYTYKYFPKVADEELITGTERMKEMTRELGEKNGKELREFKWSNDHKAFVATKMKNKIDKEFFKSFPKMFDLVVVTENEVTLKEWDKTLKKEVPVFTNTFTLTVKVSKLKEMVNGLIEEPIPTEKVEVTKDGKTVVNTYPVRGWEDSFSNKLKGLFMKFKADDTGKKIGDKNQYAVYDFTFKEGKAFAIEEPELKASSKQQGDNPFDDPTIPF